MRFHSAVLAALVAGASAEFKLHSQTFLAAGSKPAEAGHLQKIEGAEKSVVSFIRGKVGRVIPGVAEEDHEDVAGVTDVKEFSIMNTGEIIVSFLLWVVIYGLCAIYYHGNVRYFAPPDAELEAMEKNKGYEDFKDFKTGICEFKHSDICCWSICCPGIRWSDTMSKLLRTKENPGDPDTMAYEEEPIHGFWPGFLLLSSLYVIGFFPLCTLPCWLIMALYMTKHRQELRNAFQFHEKGGSTWCTDFLTLCCCMCCAVAQEARQTRLATAVEHPCINLKERTARNGDSSLK